MTAIDNYLMLETISDNASKSVYRCRDTVSQGTVILKVLKSESAGHEEVLRFKQEYSMLRELSGCVDGVIKPLKLEEQNGYFIMVLEDVQGRSLKRIMADNKPDQEALLRLFIKIVDIVGAIHEHNVIHKDIKPSNIVWDQEKDVVQVIDFDLAVKLSKEKRDFQNSGVLEGSLLYISPEQTGRMNRNIDYRTDYYSLGVVLYEMVTGVKPFESADILDQIYSIIAKEAVSPYQLTGGRVSRSLSGIIMKLMEKSPENRYRSAYGIKADLKKCLDGGGDFELAQEDKRNIFRISQKIYGREEELSRLADAFRTSLRDKPQIMLISGDAGVGKTALVNELYQYISQEKGLFAAGKFDQYNQNSPYSAMIQAFRKLIHQLLDSTDNEYKKKLEMSLRTALDGNGILITNIIPELAKLIGVQPEIEPLNPAEEINRFVQTFINFIAGITNNERPLVLFLDDVQWADLSNLQLMEKLALSNHLRKLFIICSYRQLAAPESGPLFAAIAKIERSTEAGKIALGSLSLRDVESFIADTLYAEPDRVKELSEIIYARTKGNPFFINEVLIELHKNGFIYFDDLEGQWKWVLAQISDLNINDNVVEFLMMKLQALPEEDQRVLRLCASIGNLFDYRMLSLIAEEEQRVIAKSLIKAMGEDIIIPADTNHSMLPSLLEETEDIPRDINAYFKFQHDRLQQVCYQMIDAGTSKKLHLKIGRLLLMQLAPGEIEDRLADIVTHINKGIEFISEEDEINQAIQLNLKAANQAKAVFGYDAAFAFLEAAFSLLQKSPWKNDERRTSEIYRLYAECGYLTHRTEEADKACAILLKQTSDSFAIAQVYEMQANHYTYLGMMKESIASGKRGLKALGIKIPDKPGMASVLKEFLKVKVSLRGLTIEEIFEKPEMKDEKVKLIMRLLINIFPPAYISGETSLFAFVVLKKAQLTLKYGNSPESAIAFIGYSILLSGFGDIKGAYDFGRLGIRINDKFDDLQWRGAAHVLYTLFCHVWNEPWDTLQEWFGKAVDSSLRTGSWLYLAHSCFYINLWNPAMDITSYLHESKRYIAMIENTRHKEALAMAKLARQQFLNLAGELKDPLSFNSETFSEEAYLEELEEAKYYSGINVYYIFKMKLLFTYESYGASLTYIDKANKMIGTLTGTAFMEEFSLYTFLNLAYCYKDLNAYGKVKARARMHKEYGRVRKWAAHTPENFLLHERLMKAEWARILGKNELAGKYYDLAIAACEKGNIVRYKALVYELAAKFYNSRQFTEFASYLFRQALYYYSVWGAKGKIKHINQKYQDIVKYKREYPMGRSVTDSTESIDLNSILLASQAISKEIELNNLLEALMEIVIKNAGAQRGCILLRSNTNLLVEGEYRPDDDKITVVVHRHSEDYNLPYSIIHDVEESKETLIYQDACSEAGLINDPYIIKHQPKSLVCMPLINHNKTIAIIYLENNLVTGVFTKERMRIINLLSREMVFSLENASLYTDLERSEEKYRELVNNMLDGIFIIQDMQCKFVNTALARMIGYEMEEMIEQPFDKFIAPAQREDVLALHRKRIDGIDTPGEYESRLVHKDGIQEVDVILKAISINYLNRPAVQGTVKDITERKRAEEELRKHKEHLEELVIERTKELKQNNEELNKNILLIEKISITDELTGLYNRRHFNTIFYSEVGRAGIDKGYLAYIMLDIDYYKKYNDTYGHYEGDNVLRRLGGTIKEQAAKASDYVFRLGGEEFGVIVTGLTPEQSFEYADGIRRSVEELNIPHEKSPVFGYLTVSVGVAAVRVDGLTEKDIYKLADDALYQSKADGRNRVTMLEHKVEHG
ncbi:diguanylate cyclase [Paenibacillus durus]|uniref:Diguanylate cyclase n=1 Tax=Paenibacillus durus TaxID=44251 RepID=A0A089HN88_PAEDU|nr:diguanylate cyclase [Paenibacillus durus]AIQ13411.1 hypothetical protein PDUR_16925 [Paenibacillus durus]